MKIAQRFHPFSHANGTKFLLPGTSFSVQVFPTRLNFIDLDGCAEPFSLALDLEGPIRDFTAELDLEKGFLRVFGATPKGFMRYRLFAQKGGIALAWEKAPEMRKDVWIEDARAEAPVKADERLSLGMDKSQDWPLVLRRMDLKEILPVMLRLGHFVVTDAKPASVGNYRLLDEIRNRDKNQVCEALHRFLLASFEGVLVPRLHDTEHQGILPEQQSPFHSPLPLLKRGAQMVRSLFIEQVDDTIAILPCLPPQFPCGRLTDAIMGDWMFDMEWTKKSLRLLEVRSLRGGTVSVQLPKGIKECRIKKRRQNISHGLLTLSLKPNESVQIDRFS